MRIAWRFVVCAAVASAVVASCAGCNVEIKLGVKVGPEAKAEAAEEPGLHLPPIDSRVDPLPDAEIPHLMLPPLPLLPPPEVTPGEPIPSDDHSKEA